MLEWINEGERLPPVGQKVFLAVPSQGADYWTLHVAQLLIRHEDVKPRPISAGGEWPTEYFWGVSRQPGDAVLVTGNGWWASFRDIPLPPLAEHAIDREFNYVRQTKYAWVDRLANQQSGTEG